jgi:hypothetical protein
LEELAALAESIYSKPTRYATGDDLAFMGLTFAGKQMLHARSVLRLDLHPDTVLIVRSMLEGLAQLLWAARIHQRATLWMAYAHVLDWRRIQERLAAGKRVGKRVQLANAAVMQSHGPLFAQQRKGGDGYRFNWHGTTQRAIFEEVKGDLLYQHVYGPFSEWHHWSPGGFGPMLRRTSQGTAFSAKSYVNTVAALSGAFLCLWQTLDVMETHLGLGHGAAIKAAYRRYMQEARPRKPRPKET